MKTLGMLALAGLVGLVAAAVQAQGSADGDIDWAFGGGEGGVQLPLPPGAGLWGRARVVRAQADDRVVVLGETVVDASPPGPSMPAAVVYRLLPGGELDESFGGGGMVLLAGEPNEGLVAYGLDLGPNGTVVVGGALQVPNSAPRGFVLRLTSTGEPDAGFGTAGRVEVSMGADMVQVADVVVGEDGSIVAVARWDRIGSTTDMLFARFEPDGDLDPSFGSGGLSSAQFGPAGAVSRYSLPFRLTLLNDGAVLVAGSQQTEAVTGWMTSWIVARLGADGLLDPGFNGVGFRLGRFEDATASLLVQWLRGAFEVPGGILGVGTFVDGTGAQRGAAVMLTAAGGIDGTWGNAGELVLPPAAGVSSEWLRPAAVDAVGRVVVAGDASTAVEVFVGYGRIDPQSASLDPRFRGGSDYFFLPPAAQGGHSRPWGLDIDPHGRILIAGERQLGGTLMPSLRRVVGGLPFTDGFESGSIQAWSQAVGAE